MRPDFIGEVLLVRGFALHRLLTWSRVVAVVAVGCGACQGQIGNLAGVGSPPASDSPDSGVAADAGTTDRSGRDAAARGAPDPTAATSCNDVQDVGTAPLRRLTRTEYERVVADVFNVSGSVGAGLAQDERIDGVFASNSSSPVALLQLRQYLDAAESVAALAPIAKLDSCDRTKRGDEACADQFITKFGRRAYRRLLTADERSAYVTLFRQSSTEGYEPALRLVVQTMLQSPHLLYHVELAAPSQPAKQGVARLSGYALASRLAFFLWSSAPDDRLLDAAESGELDSDSGLRAQAERLLADPRAARGVAAFHDQWLGLSKLEAVSRDRSLFPEWTPELVSALREETARFADYVIRDQSGGLSELLSASYSFPKGPGLGLRGLSSAPASGRVELQRDRTAGLLTQPAFLAAHAHSNQTSPILRGRALRERLFCQPLPDPPPNVAAVPPALEPGLTTRERYAAHRTAGSACAGCHSQIDDLGFALEHYDAIGRYRETEEGKPIDATGVLENTDVDGSMDGARSLAERMRDSAQVRRCYATQWLRFAIGRSETERDRCALQRVQASITDEDSIRTLLVAIATSDAFVQQRVEP